MIPILKLPPLAKPNMADDNVKIINRAGSYTIIGYMKELRSIAVNDRNTADLMAAILTRENALYKHIRDIKRM